MRILLIVYLFLQPASPECFVSHVAGTVTYAKNNKPVKVGDLFLPGAKFNFTSIRDFITVTCPASGKSSSVGPAVKPKKSVKPGIWTYAAEELLPSRKYELMATRDGALANPEQVRSYFNSVLGEAANPENDPYLIVGEQKLPLLKGAFGNRDRSFFYIRYYVQGKTVNKKIEYLEPGAGDDNLYIVLNQDLFKLNGRVLNPDEAPLSYKMMYYDDRKTGSDSVRTMKLRWTGERQLLEELREIKLRVRQDDVNNVLYNYIRNVYGVIDQTRFEELASQL